MAGWILRVRLRLRAWGFAAAPVEQNSKARTPETHRKQLMERLEIFDVPGLVKLANRGGLVDL